MSILAAATARFFAHWRSERRRKIFSGSSDCSVESRSAVLKAAKIGNVRVLRMESSYVVRYLLPRRSVETFYLLFPDPWPKRRHWLRRIVTLDLLKAISQALIQGGILIIATDNLNYFEKVKEIALANLDFAIVDPASVDLPLSRFARIFQQQGAAIHWLELRKVSPLR